MSKHIKLPQLPHLDHSRIIHVSKYAKYASKFVCKYKVHLLGGAAFGLLSDDIRVRIGRKKDRIEYEKNNLKHQEIERKHEAEIRACKEKADQCADAQKNVAVLEQIVQNLAVDRGDSE